MMSIIISGRLSAVSAALTVVFVAFLVQPVVGAFQDQTAALGLSPGTLKASWGDYDNDGWVDLYTTGGTYVSGALWRNNGKTGQTHNGFLLTLANGGNGGMWGDYDNDGYLDLFCSGKDTWSLWHNEDGAGLVPTSGVISTEDPWDPEWQATGISSCWADVNADGFVDVYAGGFETGVVPNTVNQHDFLLTNNQGNTLPVTWSQTPPWPSRGITACDYDQDGDIEVYASVYRLEENQLWQDNGAGSLDNVAVAAGVAGHGHSIGSAWGDLDNDGYFDLVVGNLSHDGSQDTVKFYRNRGPNDYDFEDMTHLVGLVAQESYASVALADYDNDGDLDVFITTVYEGDAPVLYRNNGGWSFTDVTVAEGLGSLLGTYQAAWADFDNDGDMDLAAEGMLWVNQGNSNNWLKVHLQGDGTNVNAAAIGAQARITLPGGGILTRQVEGGTGQGNQNDLTLHFGLGANTGPFTVEITWPDGTVEVQAGLAANESIQRRYGAPILRGDVNGDRSIDVLDFAIMADEWLGVGVLQ